MYRFLLSRHWVVLTLVALIMVPVMVRLGFWQLDRHQQRVAHNEQVAAALSAPAVPVTDLTSPGHTVPVEDRYRTVTATGSWDPSHETVARQRTGGDGDRIGFHVLTPLILADGTVVLVNRGWVPPGDDPTGYPDVPPAPKGEVTVTGLLLPDETTAATGIKQRSGLPARQVMLINGDRLARTVDRPVHGGYLQLTEAVPSPSADLPDPLPEPDRSGVGPHLAYAVNWWLLAAGVPLGWVLMVRREAASGSGPGDRGDRGRGDASSGRREAAAVG